MTVTKTSLLVLALGLSACSDQASEGAPARAESQAAPAEAAPEAMEEAAPRTYRTTGEIRQISADGRVDIAHEEVEGHMPAMTMPFFGRSDQLEGLAVGDRVSFSFIVEEGGRHVLTSITKQ